VYQLHIIRCDEVPLHSKELECNGLIKWLKIKKSHVISSLPRSVVFFNYAYLLAAVAEELRWCSCTWWTACWFPRHTHTGCQDSRPVLLEKVPLHVCSSKPEYEEVHGLIARQHISADVQYWYSSSVRPSVCHTPVLYQNDLTCHHTFFSVW